MLTSFFSLANILGGRMQQSSTLPVRSSGTALFGDARFLFLIPVKLYHFFILLRLLLFMLKRVGVEPHGMVVDFVRSCPHF